MRKYLDFTDGCEPDEIIEEICEYFTGCLCNGLKSVVTASYIRVGDYILFRAANSRGNHFELKIRVER